MRIRLGRSHSHRKLGTEPQELRHQSLVLRPRGYEELTAILSLPHVVISGKLQGKKTPAGSALRSGYGLSFLLSILQLKEQCAKGVVASVCPRIGA